MLFGGLNNPGRGHSFDTGSIQRFTLFAVGGLFLAADNAAEYDKSAKITKNSKTSLFIPKSLSELEQLTEISAQKVLFQQQNLLCSGKF